jgi:putative transposase
LNSISLNKADRDERNASVKERVLLIVRLSIDKQHTESVASELHKSRAWAYKWYKRYKNEGLEGLKDRQRSGKPSAVSNETKEKIKQELSNSNTGWDTKEVMDHI